MPPEARSGFHPPRRRPAATSTARGTARAATARGHECPEHHPPHLVSEITARQRLLAGGDINYEAWRNQSLSGASLAYLR